MTAWSLLVDVAILAYLIFGGWRGYREGVLASCANLLGLIISLVVAFSFYQPVASLLLDIWAIPQSIARIFAFLLLAFAVDAAVTGLVLLASSRVQWRWWKAKWWHWGGVAPGVINSFITAGYLCSLVLALSLDHPIKQAVEHSYLGPLSSSVVIRLGAPVDQLVTPALNDISQLLTVEPDSHEIIDLHFTVANPQLCSQAESQMLTLVNHERTSRNLEALTSDPLLQSVARAHSLDMYQRGYFSHYTPEGKDPFDRMDAAGVQYQAAGENLALAPTLAQAHTGLMNSPGHRANILNVNYHKIGIGCYSDPEHGMMFAQEFTN